MVNFKHLLTSLEGIPSQYMYGRVTAVQGMMIEVGGVQRAMSVGSRCNLDSRNGMSVPYEVVGFRNDRALLMPFGSIDGVGIGTKAEILDAAPVVHPDASWLGRVVNAMGEPIDGGPPLEGGGIPYLLRNSAPPAHARRRVGEKLDLGIRALNTFLTCCRGQRMGIFAGSGVGKSVLLSMLCRYTQADINVIGLIGERGREVQEFIEDNLGAEGLARSVVVVATSDEPPLMRRQAAYLTLAISEYFRDQGNEVLCLMDSITRFAQAQREIGLSAGEPPASKGYTPTVFAELPRLLERVGPGVNGTGNITGLFTVLVEGDDHNEPVCDAVRGTVDGHIVLERAIAERGRYPAINILRSISRTMPECNTDEETALITRARAMISRYEDMAEMIRLGAYRKGSDSEVDEAIALNPALESFLAQRIDEHSSLDEGYRQLATILGMEIEAPAPADDTPVPKASTETLPETTLAEASLAGDDAFEPISLA
ncbi:MAG: flagellar protein export ATPase FliI [Alphaproteobacteria bacterium]